MGGVPVWGAEEVEAAEEGHQLLEAAIDNMQDKVWVDNFHKVKKAHKEEARHAAEEE
jgi:hypothetical protein